MLNKERMYLRDRHFLQRHPLLQPKMRAILLDWLMEVSLPVCRALPASAILGAVTSSSWLWSPRHTLLL